MIVSILFFIDLKSAELFTSIGKCLNMERELKKDEEGFDTEPEFGIKPLKLTNKKETISGKYSRKDSKTVKSKKKIDRRLRKELLKNYGFSVDN